MIYAHAPRSTDQFRIQSRIIAILNNSVIQRGEHVCSRPLKFRYVTEYASLSTCLYEHL